MFEGLLGILAAALALLFGRGWWAERKRARDLEDELAVRRRAEARHVAAAEAALRKVDADRARRPAPDPRRREEFE